MRYIFLLPILFFLSCKKEWLLVKQDKTLVVPQRLVDLQAIMDEDFVLNAASSHIANLAEVGCDNFFLEDQGFQNLNGFQHLRTALNAYLFLKDIYIPDHQTEYYSYPYKRIFYANIVLDALDKLNATETDPISYNNVKGSALFVRSYAYFWLTQIYAPAYHEATASTDKGIALKGTSDIGTATVRSSVEDCYRQMIDDLRQSTGLLPVVGANPSRPSKAAASALLARVFMSMGKYDSALVYADESLRITNALMDFNLLDSTITNTITRDYSYGTEVIYSDVATANFFQRSTTRIDTTFYDLFDDNDLRKVMFFMPRAGTPYNTFRGSYEGSSLLFVGMSTNEMYLTRAECYARTGSITEALVDLNTLMLSRWRAGEYMPYFSSEPEQVLDWILVERRKELCFRGLRWMDLRRLNNEPGKETTVVHRLEGIDYMLEPGSKRYVYPFPPDVILLSGIEQNER